MFIGPPLKFHDERGILRAGIERNRSSGKPPETGIPARCEIGPTRLPGPATRQSAGTRSVGSRIPASTEAFFVQPGVPHFLHRVLGPTYGNPTTRRGGAV